MQFNIRRKNGYVICLVDNIWCCGVGRDIQGAIENFLKDFGKFRR